MTPDLDTILIALGLTTIAGLSTGIGALVSFFVKRADTRLLSAAMGLSAGVMIYVSFMELLPEAHEGFGTAYGDAAAKWVMLLTFFGGLGLAALIDRLIPEDENPHEMHTLSELDSPDNHHLKRTGLMLAIALTIHNFPEGMATFITALEGVDVALPIVIAIAIHNIPEGIAISVPIYQSTGNRRRAICYSLASGLAETAGALIGMLFLLPFWTPQLNSFCIAAVAGIMVYISFDELLPGAERYGHHHLSLGGVILGMAIMGVTL